MALTFVRTNQNNFPQGHVGRGTALCVMSAFGDPFVATVTQQRFQDRLQYLSRADLVEYVHHTTTWVDPALETITGMDTDGKDPTRLYCIEGTRFEDQVHILSSETGERIDTIKLEESEAGNDSTATVPQGFCMDESSFYITFADRIVQFDRSGSLVQSVQQPRTWINGITRLDRYFLAVTAETGSLLLLDGNLKVIEEIALGGPQPPSRSIRLGVHAVAVDPYRDMDKEPKIWLPSGKIELEPYENAIANGWHSDHHPDCKWIPEPAPQFGRHKIFVADRETDLIYAGYLTEN